MEAFSLSSDPESDGAQSIIIGTDTQVRDLSLSPIILTINLNIPNSLVLPLRVSIREGELPPLREIPPLPIKMISNTFGS